MKDGNSYYVYYQPKVPEKGQIFTFSSNTKGQHRHEAALTAYRFYGAMWGQGMGLFGSSYAIPTKTVNNSNLTLPEIESNIRLFVAFTQLNPQLKFFLTNICGGFSPIDTSIIAPMFKGVQNSLMPDIWQPYIEEKET